ncbi:MAG: hypothetical protein Q9215_007552 [Flavoplaca cf. flavocitrina]
MDMDTSTQDGDAGHDNPQPPSQLLNEDQNLDPSVNQVDSQNDNTADDNPASQPNSQPASQPNGSPNSQHITQPNGSPYTQPTAQPNDTQNFQADGHLETQTPPSGQGDPTEEEPIDPQELLQPFEWDDLEERFSLKMEGCRRQEAEIEKEFREWCYVGRSFLFNPPTVTHLAFNVGEEEYGSGYWFGHTVDRTRNMYQS